MFAKLSQNLLLLYKCVQAYNYVGDCLLLRQRLFISMSEVVYLPIFQMLTSYAPAVGYRALKVGNVNCRAVGAAMLDAIIPGRNKSGVDSFRPISH